MGPTGGYAGNVPFRQILGDACQNATAKPAGLTKSGKAAGWLPYFTREGIIQIAEVTNVWRGGSIATARHCSSNRSASCVACSGGTDHSAYGHQKPAPSVS